MTKSKSIVAYKGFDKNLQCRGYQYQIGKTFNHDGKVEACESGFHACEYPLGVFGHYPPADSRYAIVKMGGELSKETNGDTKIASAKIKIEAEINLHEIISRSVKWIIDRCKPAESSNETGDLSAATNTGDRSAATNTGNWSAAKVTGNQSVAIATGFESKAMASKGSAIVLIYRNNDGEIVHIRASKVGENGVKPDTWYRLDETGGFVEVTDEND